MKDFNRAIKKDFTGYSNLSNKAKEGLSIFSNDLEDACLTVTTIAFILFF